MTIVLKKTLTGVLVGVFLFTITFGWAEGERPFSARTEDATFSSRLADNNKLAPESRFESEDFKYSLTVVAICKHVEHDGNLEEKSYLNDILTRLGTEKNSHITVLPYEIIIEIPNEGLAVRYFDPTKANVITPYFDISRLSTKVIGPRLNRQIIFRIKSLHSTYQEQIEKFEKFISSERSIFSFERDLLAQHWGRLRYIIDDIINGNAPEMVLNEIEIQPESSCNLDCKHCVGRAYRPNRRIFISVVTMERFVRSVIEYNEKHPNLKISRLRFSGFYGEPLVNKKALLAGIKIALSAGIEVGLFTNGLLLDKEAREAIVDGTYVHVSLDAGSEQSHEAIKGKEGFEKAIQNIKYLARLRKERGSKLRITVGYILHKENHFEIYNTIRRLKESGADIVRFKMNIAPTEDQLLEKEEIDEAFRQITRARDDFEDDNFKIVTIHSQGEAESKVVSPNFRRCYFAYLVGVIGDRSTAFACDHSTGVSEDDKRWFGHLEQDKYMNILKVGSQKLAAIEPITDCRLCPPFGYKVNSFVEFLRQAAEITPGFIDYIEIKYVTGLKRDLALTYIKSVNYETASKIYNEVATIFKKHGDIIMATKMEDASKMWDETAKAISQTNVFVNAIQSADKNTILISGGAGFVGRHLIENLLTDSKVSKIVILISQEDDRSNVLQKLDPRIKLEVCDICDVSKINSLLKWHRPKIVYHLAGSLIGAYNTNLAESESVYNINVGGTLNLVNAAHENGTELFVYTSSTRIYGKPTDKDDAINEEAKPNPVYVYEVSKSIGEEIIRAISQHSAMRYIIARLTNVSGDFHGGAEHNEARDVTARFISAIFNNRSIVIYLDSSDNKYNFINVETVAIVLAQIRNRTDMHNQCFNIGLGAATSLEDLLKTVEEVLGKKAVREKTNEPGGLSNVSTGVVFSNAKVRRYLGGVINFDIDIREVVGKSVEKFIVGVNRNPLTINNLAHPVRVQRNYTSLVQEYLNKNETLIKNMLGENKPDTLIRVPVEAIESVGIDNIKDFLATFQEVPNGYIELYYMSGSGEVSENIYQKYRLQKKPLPKDFKRNRENTVTLFPALKGEEINQSVIVSRLGNFNVTTDNTILSPIGLQHDPAGLIRATILGLKIMDIARQIKEKRININKDQAFKDEIQLEILEQLKSVCDADDLKNFNLTPDDIIALATGTINNIIVALKKLIKLLPITPINTKELRQTYEHVKKVITAT